MSGGNDPVEIETTIRDAYATLMFAGVIGTAVATAEQRRVPYGRGVSFEEVRLDGEFPDTQLVILLRAESDPGVLFGRRRRLWEEDGSPVEMADILIGIHLQEESGPASLDSRPVPTLTRRALRGSEPPALPRSGCRIANSSRLGITVCATLCRSACIFLGTREERRASVPATLRLTREGFGMELRRGPFELAVDGESVGSIKRHGTVETPLEPGHHTVRLRSGRYSSRDQSFDAVDGEVVNFRCHGAMVWPRYIASIVKPDLAISLKRE